jgi:hypothetical protein
MRVVFCHPNIQQTKDHEKTHHFDLRGDTQCRHRSIRRIHAGILTDSIWEPGISKAHVSHASGSGAGQTGQLPQMRHETRAEGRKENGGNTEGKL